VALDPDDVCADRLRPPVQVREQLTSQRGRRLGAQRAIALAERGVLGGRHVERADPAIDEVPRGLASVGNLEMLERAAVRHASPGGVVGHLVVRAAARAERA
jgi:hypothetical protein